MHYIAYDDFAFCFPCLLFKRMSYIVTVRKIKCWNWKVEALFTGCPKSMKLITLLVNMILSLLWLFSDLMSYK